MDDLFIGGPEKVQRRQRKHRIEETAKSYFVLMNVTFNTKQEKLQSIMKLNLRI